MSNGELLGTVLGLIFFNIFINDLNKGLEILLPYLQMTQREEEMENIIEGSIMWQEKL